MAGPTLLDRYRARGLAGRVGFGERPAVVVVDLILGFTDPESPLGADLDAVVGVGPRVEAAARVAAAAAAPELDVDPDVRRRLRRTRDARGAQRQAQLHLAAAGEHGLLVLEDQGALRTCGQ